MLRVRYTVNSRGSRMVLRDLSRHCSRLDREQTVARESLERKFSMYNYLKSNLFEVKQVDNRHRLTLTDSVYKLQSHSIQMEVTVTTRSYMGLTCTPLHWWCIS